MQKVVLITGASSGIGKVTADVIAKTINSKNPKTRYVAGKMAKMTLFMRRWLSDRAFDSAVLRMLN